MSADERIFEQLPPELQPAWQWAARVAQDERLGPAQRQMGFLLTDFLLTVALSGWTD